MPVPFLRDVVIAGLSFRDQAAKDYAKIMPEGTLLVAVPEPTNPHDPYAVKVMTLDSTLHLGYIPRESSAAVALLLAEAGDCEVRVTGISKAGFKTISVFAPGG